MEKVGDTIGSLRQSESSRSVTVRRQVSRVPATNTIEARAQKVEPLAVMIASDSRWAESAQSMDTYLFVCQKIPVDDFKEACGWMATHWDSASNYGAPSPADLRRCALRIAEAQRSEAQSRDFVRQARRLQEARAKWKAEGGKAKELTPAESLKQWEAKPVPTDPARRKFHVEHIAFLRRKIGGGR